MDVRNLHVLAVVAEERSFTAAARRLHTSQSALSQLVRRVETELGFTVFDRSISPVDLTPAGRRFVRHAREIDDLYTTALAASRETSRTTPTVIGASPRAARILFPVLLAEAREHASGAELRLIEGSSRELSALVAKGVVDVAVISSPAAGEGLAFVPVLSSGFFAVLSTNLTALVSDGDLPARELAAHDLLLPSAGGVRTHLAPFLDGLGEVTVALESASTETLLGLAELELGVAIVPELVVTASDRDRLVGVNFVRIVDGPPPLSLGIALRAGVTATTHLQAARELVHRALVLCFAEHALKPIDGSAHGIR